MAWDASRPVPWRRLVNEWLVYVAIMFVLLVLFFDNQSLVGLIAGLLVSGPLYLAFGYVLAKFGYRRKSLKELRAETSGKRAPSTREAGEAADTPAPGPKPKPAPTSRTGGGSGGPGRPGGKRKRR
ncbi:MAG: hypothetical protein CL424_14045 [Acidimicrobiaceae bacterium]|nr:hypothetical protein [Acidimicrobiaceae bacterium]